MLVVVVTESGIETVIGTVTEIEIGVDSDSEKKQK